MIASLRINNVKLIAAEALRFAPPAVCGGEDASAKSTIRTASRLLQGLGEGFPLAETSGGRY